MHFLESVCVCVCVCMCVGEFSVAVGAPAVCDVCAADSLIHSTHSLRKHI